MSGCGAGQDGQGGQSGLHHSALPRCLHALQLHMCTLAARVGESVQNRTSKPESQRG